MNTQQTGFGIVGAGNIAHVHAKAIAAIGSAKLLGIYSSSEPKAQAFGLEHNCTAYATLEEMVANPAINIICICTPSGIHLEPALTCINAGKHCLIEKPLEITLERCDRIIEAAARQNLQLGVIFPSRFYDESIALKKVVEQNRLGHLALGSAYVKWSRTKEYYQSSKWRGTWQFDGGGALMNQGIHSVDLLQWYMGTVDSVQAFTANIRHKTIEAEDTLVATLQYANGALGTLECSTAIHPGSLKRIEILGTEGSVVLEENNITKWEFAAGNLVLPDHLKQHAKTQGGVADPSDISFAGHQKQIEDFIAAVNNNRTPAIDGVEGRKSVAIVVAAYTSARTGKTIRLSTLQ